MSSKSRNPFCTPGTGDDRSRDVFPLPTLDVDGIRDSSLGRKVQRRIQCRGAIARRANLAISALNSLYFGHSCGGGQSVHSLDSLPLVQQDCIRNILRAVRQLGPVPEDACCSGALQALRTAGSSYSEPVAGVGDVVPMQLGHMSLPSGKVAGVDLHEHLDDKLRDVVSDFENHMLQDASVWTEIEDQAARLTPYNDPLLKQRSGYLSFLRKLHECGVLCFSSRCRGRVGAFCVSKKPKVVDNKVVNRQRLVLDCRAVNLQFKDPPRTHLGSLSSVAEAVIPPGEKLYVATADICDCFYACHLPTGMEEFFGLYSDVSFQEAVEISGGTIAEDAISWDRIVPCISVLPMGFNWSFYLVQAIHEAAALSALGKDRSSLFLDSAPAPLLSSSSCSTMPYCDNVHVLSLSSQLCQAGKVLVCKRLEDMGFVLHEHTSAACLTQTLGGVIDGDIGEVRCSSKRVWSLIFAFTYITTHVASRELVQRLLGHAMVACVINRGGMGIFRRLYDYVHSSSPPRRLSPLEVRECHIFIGLLPLMTADLRRQWCPTVTCSDASPQGWGITERDVGEKVTAAIGAWQERWRFKRLGPENWKPRERALGRDPFSDPLTVVGTSACDDIEDIYEQDPLFPEVPRSLMSPSSWHTVSMGKWKHTEEHITLKEARSLLIAVRRLSRARKNRFRRHLILLDNMALCFAVNKGRSANYAMLRVLQQIGSIALAAGLTLRPRWVPSELNVSDNPSRGNISPGVNLKQPEQPCPGYESCQNGEWETSTSWEGRSPMFEGDQSSSGSKEDTDTKETSSQSFRASPTARSEEDEVDTKSEEDHFRHGGAGEQEEKDFGIGVKEYQCRGENTVPRVLQQVRGLLQGERDCDGKAHSGRHGRLPHRLHGSTVSRKQIAPRRREDFGRCRVHQHLRQRQADSCPKGVAGLEENSPSSESSAPPTCHDVRDGHGACVARQTGDVPQSDHGLHPVPASRRGHRLESKKHYSSSTSRWKAIQVDHSGGSRPGGIEARQGGRVRQQHPHRYEQACLGGRSIAEEGKGAQKQRLQDLRLHHGLVSGQLCQSGQGIGCRESSPVPVEARRSDRGPLIQKQGSSSGKGQRKVANRSECEEVHEDWPCSAVAEQTDCEPTELLQVVREKPSQSVSRNIVSSIGNSLLKPVDIFTDVNRPRRFCIEIFAGTARVSQSLQAVGFTAYPIDICLFPSHNVLNPDVAKGIFNFMRHGRVQLLWIGMPCTTFSRARRNDGLGPGPLRSPEHLWGLLNLKPSDRRKLQEGNQLFRFTIKLLELCEAYSIPYVLENPLTSMAWDMEPMRYFISHYSPKICELDFCMFGEIWRKPTKLLYNFLQLDELNLRCQGKHNICSRSNRPHFALKGRDAAGVFWTLRAQPYPWSLTSKFASLVASTL